MVSKPVGKDKKNSKRHVSGKSIGLYDNYGSH
jgi:hypothetical protein